jgi:hypothetical protein
LVYAEATVITEKINEYSKRGKNWRKKNLCMVGIKRQIRNCKKKYKLLVLAEKRTGSDHGKFNGKTRENNQKHKVINVGVIVLLAGTVKQIVQVKVQRIARYKQVEKQYTNIKMFREDTKKYSNLDAKNIEIPHPVAVLESYSKLLWGERLWRNETTDWIRREERRKVSNMDE